MNHIRALALTGTLLMVGSAATLGVEAYVERGERSDAQDCLAYNDAKLAQCVFAVDSHSAASSQLGTLALFEGAGATVFAGLALKQARIIRLPKKLM